MKLNFKFGGANWKKILLTMLLASWLIAAGGVGIQHYMYAKNLKSRDSKIESLTSTLAQVGDLVQAYKVRADVTSGKEIEETDLESIDVPVSIATNFVKDLESIKGMRYKVGLKSGTPLSLDNLYEEKLTDDLRYYDIVTHSNPIGLDVETYVDIRIALPLGEDYIAISHKQVKEINSGILKCAITESDIHTYNSMLVDSLLYPGSQIYAVEYVEGGVQKAADTYYPISSNIINIAEKDPNLLNKIKADIVVRRNILEQGLSSVVVEDTRRQDELQNGRAKIIEQLSSSQKELDKQKAELAREQSRLQGEEGGSEGGVVLGG